ncbi:flagellar export chaperone FlgN [Pluralibacter gergoviae]|uniref:flagellar export chaperone FlgN n=1 Tax=Pluralibacter gergoviae TaxID=61647 RepID=UPI000A3BA4B9|nr:flagellar export chaperone FlgN [Pluralibacter gergoviae]EKT9641551.1 flagellar export chaperone FlgN [Pluralibacter gergoviae]EKV3543945.1 flagellar export chaperone FlgN [Pluralibacter gergoviae]EKV9900207.1 flagellar export chaperone FlgN [Pluralibacter gergoviae]EKV9929812.1 flagellar export chaperone FlgN [Pluralibacter gergoviae]EKW9974197.1 flagellar export chaperone FlgN [Pluralibacter gergoviae]
MASLSKLLAQIADGLNALRAVMESERLLLCEGSLSGSHLQRVTEEKSSLLATLGWLEQQRLLAWSAADSAAQAQWQWQTIQAQTQTLREMNQHNGWLLEQQMAFNQQALALLKPHQEAGLYGKDGLAANRVDGGVRFSV